MITARDNRLIMQKRSDNVLRAELHEDFYQDIYFNHLIKKDAGLRILHADSETGVTGLHQITQPGAQRLDGRIAGAVAGHD